LDGIPYFESNQYLIVYRNPIDAYFSVRNHMLNMLDPSDMPQLSDDPREGFRAWVDAPFQEGVGEQCSLEAFIYHFLSYRKYTHLENFHFFHFADMKRSIHSTVQRIAQILNIETSQGRVIEICEAVSFAEIKKKASSYAPASGRPIFKSDNAFFSSGTNSQWQGKLTSAELEHYSNRINELLTSDAVNWIENGNRP
jgi:aryl sulfotransferase